MDIQIDVNATPSNIFWSNMNASVITYQVLGKQSKIYANS